ncbi:glutathione S-transferase [Polychaeton citri CBS 116435]|uniref:Glutathione S-transferase n=1 Tax=Polychaeton citri CBS 116435 TaxID=1314669 RepID=A0A9P4Q2R2_9PEZI|nr:glutathione S-transferase [Polychaeton citri CBS 116435]
MAPQPEDITLFYWALSPWASKVVHYLSLRQIPHAQCDQPVTLPRPDMKALGLNYRRVPVVTIGRDIYCDTLLILEKLEELFPPSGGIGATLGAQSGTNFALEKLLEKWTDVCVFKPAAAAIPTTVPLLQDQDFIKDRTELWSRDWNPAEQDRLRPAGLSDLRANFSFLEQVLSDGRQWITGAKQGPALADIHAAWIFTWMLSLPDGLPEQYFSASQFPKTRKWLDRYIQAVEAAKNDNAPRVKKLESEKAITRILASDFLALELAVLKDPRSFVKGQEVEIYPNDTGSDHKDKGKLIGLDTKEIVLEKRAPSGEGVRMHFPRWNYSIVADAIDQDDALGDDPLGLRPTVSRMKSSREFGHLDF